MLSTLGTEVGLRKDIPGILPIGPGVEMATLTSQVWENLSILSQIYCMLLWFRARRYRYRHRIHYICPAQLHQLPNYSPKLGYYGLHYRICYDPTSPKKYAECSIEFAEMVLMLVK